MTIQSILRGALCAGTLLVPSGVVQKAQAANFVVSNINDSGGGSLRQAVQAANAQSENDTISFSPTVFATPKTITLTSGELSVLAKGTLSIIGPGIESVTVSGNNTSRIFKVSPGANLSLSQLSMGNGWGQITSEVPGGGAIFNEGTLTLTTVKASGSRTSLGGRGGAIYNGGGFVTLTNSRIQDCTASPEGVGGAIYNGGAGARVIINGGLFSGNSAGSGGIIRNDVNATATVNQTTFASNTAGTGGAVSNSGHFIATGALFQANKATDGGAVANLSGNAELRNCTATGNEAAQKGGVLFNSSASDSELARLTVESSTVVSNRGLTGGAISNDSLSRLTLNNSIVTTSNAPNGSGVQKDSISGPVTDGDYNLVDVPDGATLPGSHNILNSDPLLGVLADNGGQVKTFVPANNSPVIDAGNSTLATDQRGFARPVDALGNAKPGNGSDIGAFEVAKLSQNGTDFVVNSTDDHNDGSCSTDDCTLREAIIASNSARYLPTITFSPAKFGSKVTLRLNSELPTPTNYTTITGPSAKGAGVTITNPSGTIMTTGYGPVVIFNLTFADSPQTGIINYGNLDVIGCTFTNCNIGVRNGSTGPNSFNQVNLRNSTFYKNRFTGLYVEPDTTSSVESCTFVKNGVGIYIDKGSVGVKNSILVDNGNGNNVGGTTYQIGDNGYNIISYAIAPVKLDYRGLQDNGGPTPTVALLPGSTAIDAGSTDAPIDQRGEKRGLRPDIGAFEANTPPLGGSVYPRDTFSRVGNKVEFLVRASDENGVGDIKEMWLLINDRLGWESGATLIYRPSVADPTRGTLTLRRGDAFLPEVPVGTGVTSSTIFDNGAVRLATGEVRVIKQDNTLLLILPLTLRDGLVGQNTLFTYVSDRSGATDPNAETGDNGFVRVGSYTVFPQFSTGTNAAPIVGRLQPSATNTVLNALGIAPNAQTMLFSVSDADGMGDIESLLFIAGKGRGFANGAVFVYYPRDRRLYLRSDNGQSWLGGIQVGQPNSTGILENSQVRVDVSNVRVTIGGDGRGVALSIPMQAKTGLLGANKVWLRTQDRKGATAPNGDDQGYVLSGTWNVTQNTSASPSKASNGAS